MPWYKGNLHCHSTQSDGTSSPVEVAQYYKASGYDFLGISDHNQYTPVETYAAAAGILGIPCCEYTGQEACHVLAAGVTEAVAPNLVKEDMWERAKPDEALALKSARQPELKKVLILQDGIDKTLSAGGIPIICHPSWQWAYDHQDVAKLQHCTHFELCNASPDCNSFPLPGRSFLEDMWDALLSDGVRLIGMAADDAHRHSLPYSTRVPIGGSGWNMVKAPELTETHILQAIKQGHCYASTGVVLADYRVLADRISVQVKVHQQEKTCIQFFGRNGRELQTDYASQAEYQFAGDETYVRCRIASTAGVWAWTQPVFLDDLQRAIAWTA